MEDFARLKEAIKFDQENLAFTQQGIDPLYIANEFARICIIGQAPGIRAQETQIPFNDPSGDRLRLWLGMSCDFFYHSPYLAILPMDFYYPGKGKSGDLPPRKHFAQKWHPAFFDLMPHLELIILVGSYAQAYYLPKDDIKNSTDRIKQFYKYGPLFFPIVHPSPRNNIWLKKNPWFECEIVPVLREKVAQIIAYTQKN